MKIRHLALSLIAAISIAYRVEDLDTGEVSYQRNDSRLMQIASCRKLFSTGLALVVRP